MGLVDELLGDDAAGAAPTGIDYVFRDNANDLRDVDVVVLTSVVAVAGDRRIPGHERARRAKHFARSLQRRRIPLIRLLTENDVSREGRPSHAEEIIDHAARMFIAPTGLPTHRDLDVALVPRAHLRDRFLGYPRPAPIPGRLLCMTADTFQPFHESTLKVFAASDLGDATLRMVGTPPGAMSSSFDRTIRPAASRVTLLDGSLSDAARVAEISVASLLIAEAPRTSESMHAIISALSLDTPVLTEATPQTRRLADEVGHSWLRLHPGRLTPAILEGAVRELGDQPPTGRPTLDQREPNTIASRYADAIRTVAGR